MDIQQNVYICQQLWINFARLIKKILSLRYFVWIRFAAAGFLILEAVRIERSVPGYKS